MSMPYGSRVLRTSTINLTRPSTSYVRNFQRTAERGVCQTPDGITLSVEGNIGVGKTTFLKKILSAPSNGSMKDLVNFVEEPVSSWQKVQRKGEQEFNLLEQFYKNPNRYAYTFQHYVFMTRFLQEERTRKTKLPLRIIERSVCSDRNVFTEVLREKGWLSELEYSLYESWYWPTIQAFPTLIPNGFIYLRATPETCFRRLQSRARGEELDIDLAYLQCLHHKHEHWLVSTETDSPSSCAYETTTTHVDMNFGGFIRKMPVLLVDCNADLIVARDESLHERVQQDILKFCELIKRAKHEDINCL